jgi:hypothetical protein
MPNATATKTRKNAIATELGSPGTNFAMTMA